MQRSVEVDLTLSNGPKLDPFNLEFADSFYSPSSFATDSSLSPDNNSLTTFFKASPKHEVSFAAHTIRATTRTIIFFWTYRNRWSLQAGRLSRLNSILPSIRKIFSTKVGH